MGKLLFTLLAAGMLFAADAPRRAPGFALSDSNLKIHDLYDYRGKPVILEFMRTNCPHCAAFVLALEKVQQKYGDKVAILAVANPPDNPTTMSQFVAGHKIAYPVLFDMGQAAYSYMLTATFDLPQVFLIDAQGMISRQWGYSPMTRDIFEGNGLIAEIDRLLAASATPAPRKK
jgi:peroxiredoxin